MTPQRATDLRKEAALCDRGPVSTTAFVSPPAIAVVALVTYLGIEPLMRKGAGRELTTASFEHYSTALVASIGLLIPAIAIALRFLDVTIVGPLPPFLAWLLLLPLLLAIPLRWWSMATLGEAFTRTLRILPGHAVVQSGPYRAIRHPGYLANLLAFPPAGALIADSCVFGLLALVVQVTAYIYRIGYEEEMLATHLGAAYAEYQRRTWRLLPWIY
jgi:protein-S-isoprenylcysteine O-methyltransferase Ste14